MNECMITKMRMEHNASIGSLLSNPVAEVVDPLPQIQDDVVFSDFKFISDGTRAFVYKVKVHDG